MADFTVKYVEGGPNLLWADYNSDKPSKVAKKAGKDGSLGLTMKIKAKTEKEARDKFAAKHPNCTIMRIDRVRTK